MIKSYGVIEIYTGKDADKIWKKGNGFKKGMKSAKLIAPRRLSKIIQDTLSQKVESNLLTIYKSLTPSQRETLRLQVMGYKN